MDCKGILIATLLSRENPPDGWSPWENLFMSGFQELCGFKSHFLLGWKITMEGCVAVWQRWTFMVLMMMISFFPHFSLWSLWKLLPPPPSPCWPASRLRQYSSKCLSSMRSTKNSMMGSCPECSSGVTSSVLGTSSRSWWVSGHHQRCWYPSPISQELEVPFGDCTDQRDQSL